MRAFRRLIPLVPLVVSALFFVSCGHKNPAGPDDSDDDTDPNRIYVHNASAGVLATLDIRNGSVTVVGTAAAALTDIALDRSGNLFGISGTQLFRINKANASATLVGEHGVPGGNSLTFGSDGTLYAAGAFDLGLYTLNPNTAASTRLGNIIGLSAGDLAFHQGTLYFAATGDRVSDILIKINVTNPSASTVVGNFGVPEFFGLISKNNLLYGVSGTTLYTVDPATAKATTILSFANQGITKGGGLASIRAAR